jgi:PhnB protein
MAITPYLYYEDLGSALTFLSKAFGFRKYGRAMSGPDGKLNHAAMKLGDDVIMMGYPGSKYKNPRRLKQATQCLYINVNNVEKHFERAKKAGAKIISEPEDTFYGHRRYGAEDPEGHQWYFFHEIESRKVGKPQHSTRRNKY